MDCAQTELYTNNQLWGYKAEKKLQQGVSEQKELNTADLNYGFVLS
jgi:hypothetical protein